MAAELEVIVAAVTGAITGGAVKPALAPVEAVAEVWKDRVKARLERTADRARAKAGDDLTLNERTAAVVLREAGFTDDPVVHEYLGGVLAGAGTEDDGVHIAAMVGRLTPLQLRLHYVLYRGFYEATGTGFSYPQAMILIPLDDLNQVFHTIEKYALGRAAQHLAREDLLTSARDGGIPVVIEGATIDRMEFKLIESSGRIPRDMRCLAVWASLFGAELYRWCAGNRSSGRPTEQEGDLGIVGCRAAVLMGDVSMKPLVDNGTPGS